MTTTISVKGQLVIPAPMRRRYHLTPKTRVDVLDTGYAIVILPAPKGDAFFASRGLLQGKLSTQELLRYRRQERTREAKALR